MGIHAGFVVAGGAALLILVISLVSHDYTKDEKGNDIKEKIDDYLLPL